MFLPLSQDSRTLHFLNLRGRLDSSNGSEGNLGLGARRMVEGGWNLGAYAYLDQRRTPQGSVFNQSTLGAEALGRDWDLRANVYFPTGGRVNSLGPGASTASVSGNALVVTTPMREERALGGHDAEVGWRVPLFDAEHDRQLRIYLGTYRFADSAVRVEGVRLRAEYAVAQWRGLWRGAQLLLGAEAQDDNARGGLSFVSLRLRIPLGEGHASASRLTAQERRMTAPVVRDVDIVSQVVAATSLVETATATANGQSLTVLSSSATTGAALPGAVAAAGNNSTVLLSGTFNTTATTQLQTGQTLMGAGMVSVRTASGRVVTVSSPGATIVGAVAGNSSTVQMADNSTLTGMTVSNVSTGGGSPNPMGVYVSGVSGATIHNNTISATHNLGGGGSAIAVSIAGNPGNITVTDNTVTAVGMGVALGVYVDTSSATLRGNTLSATGGGPNSFAVGLNAANIQSGSTGNTIANGVCIALGAGTGTVMSFTNAANCGP